MFEFFPLVAFDDGQLSLGKICFLLKILDMLDIIFLLEIIVKQIDPIDLIEFGTEPLILKDMIDLALSVGLRQDRRHLIIYLNTNLILAKTLNSFCSLISRADISTKTKVFLLLR